MATKMKKMTPIEEENCICCPECGEITDIEIITTASRNGKDIEIQIVSEDFFEEAEILEDEIYSTQAFSFGLLDGDDTGVVCYLNNKHPFFDKFIKSKSFRDTMIPVLNGMALGWGFAYHNLIAEYQDVFYETTKCMFAHVGGYTKNYYEDID